MPSAETGITFGFIFLRNAGFVKSSMGGVFEDDSTEAFVISHSTVADKLNLGQARDCLEDGLKDRVLCRLCLVVAVPIDLGLRIESLNGITVRLTTQNEKGDRKEACLGKRILLFWGESNISEQEGIILVDEMT